MTERIFAPWRMEYLKAPKEAGCVFCNAQKAPTDHCNKAHILARRSNAYVILNRYPYGFGHILIVPNRHVASLGELSKQEQCAFFELVSDAEAALRKAVNPQGINLGMNIGKQAGAGIEDHLHMHIVPRWVGDTNFMPLLADCRIIPAHLDEIMSLLQPCFTPLSGAADES